MLILNWDKRLELGIEHIDRQHKDVITHANTFFISYKGGNSTQRLGESLTFLEQYVLYHFQAEEAFQADVSYPGFLAHQAEHSTLKMQFKIHQTRLVASSFSRETVDAFYVFFREWIFNHILIEDIAFANYYRDEQNKKIENPQ